MARLGERAVVLGASIAGLLAARVLADFYDTVTVVERDVLPDDPVYRRGLPQGRHAHLLWGRGCAVIEELFPGFVAELDDAGAPHLDGDLSRIYINTGGHPLPPTGHLDRLRFIMPSRALLDCHVRQRICEVANVEIRAGHDVVAPIAKHDRVCGAIIRAHGEGTDEALEADLVIDAMGRGGRTSALLEQMGYRRPAEDGIEVRLMYSSLPVKLPPTALSEVGVIIGPVAGRPTGMALLRNEHGTAMFTVYGMAGVEPPAGLDEMLSFVRGFTPAHVVSAIQGSEAIGNGAQHRMPSTRWRRYDKMRRWPAGLLAIGDAICSFNPIYAQGMTVAALEAQLLQACLRGGTDRLQQRYFQATATPIGHAWQLATGGDLSLPEVAGPRPLPIRVANRYLKLVQAAARSDAFVAQRYIQVAGLIDAPTALMHPGVAAHVAVSSLKRSRSAPG